MSSRRIAGLALAALLAVAASARTHAAAGTAAEVSRELIDVPGAQEPHTPARYNRGLAFRYFVPGAPPPGVVLVLIPGLNSGPNTLDILARQLTSRATDLEVWVTSPRPTLLQDRRGVEAALRYGQPDFALAYYYGRLDIGGHRYHPLPADATPYAAYWGLDVALRDIRAIVEEAHRRYPAARVVLGGHSLGGILAALYAGYDFGRPPGDAPVPLKGRVPAPAPDAGFRDIAGLVLLDGLPLDKLPRLGDGGYLNGVHVPFFPHIPGVRALTDPNPRRRAEPFTNIEDLARPRDSILFDVIAAYAYLRPEDASYLPFYPRVYSRGALAITNAALLAAVLSGEMQPDLFIRASLGSPLGVFKHIPDPADVNPRGLLKLASGRPARGHTLIRWIPYDRSTPRGRVDLRTLTAAILRPGADFTEWYLPWRLILDIGLSENLDTSGAFARRYMSLTQVRYTAVPVLILGADQGLIRRPDGTRFYRARIATPRAEVHVEIFRGFTHLDLVSAADNPAVPRILEWLRAGG